MIDVYKRQEAVILTLLEKETHHYLAIRIPGKTSEAVNAAMQKLREDLSLIHISSKNADAHATKVC